MSLKITHNVQKINCRSFIVLRITSLLKREKSAQRRELSAAWLSDTTNRLQIVHDGFDSRLELITFNVEFGWLKR